LVLSVLASSAIAQAPPQRQSGVNLTRSFEIPARDVRGRHPDGWSVAREASGYTLLNVPLEKQGTLGAAALARTAQITVDIEDRRDHAEAVRRLKEIAAEVDSPVSFLNIGGWPALQRRFLAPKPMPSQGGATPLPGRGVEMQLNITTAVAAGDLLVRLDGRLLPDAPPEIADQIEAIGRSLVFPTRTGNPGQVDQEINHLRTTPSLRPSPPKAVQQDGSLPASASGIAPLANAQASSIQASPELAVPVGVPVNVGSELTVAVSPNGANIVIGSNSGYNFSTDSGQHWTRSTGLGNSDPSLAWGQSGGANGTFYAANIAAPSTAISVSTDNGRSFAPATNAFTCPGTPPSCGGFGFPDQEQIASDRVNVAAGGDRVYAAWRNGGTNYGIVCTANSAGTWSPAPATLTAGDFPRITVGQDGIVWVVYQSGGNLMLNSYSACNGSPPAAMTPRAGFPVTVVSGVSLTCPIPGIDRCTTGSIHMVAVDDNNPNHIYVAYTNSAAGNENVMVQDSMGGINWSANPANHRVATVSTGAPTRRFMPWVCAVGGSAQVTWYDRGNSTPCATPPCAANNDLTDYFAGMASLDLGGNLVAGPQIKINPAGSTDAQCAAGAAPGSAASWPFGVRQQPDSESCNVQPQLAGFCCLPCPQGTGDPCVANGDACGAGSSLTRCDFDEGPACTKANESCVARGGAPKYGDYNGNACALGRLFSAWASATPAESFGGLINTFFALTVVTPTPTTTTYTGATTGDYHDTVTLSAVLTLSGTTLGVAGQTITFTLGNQPCPPQTTNPSGFASCSLTLNQQPGLPYTVKASFAGAGLFQPSSDSKMFTITREETTTTYTGPTVIANGVNTTFSAVLKEDGTVPVSGRTIKITLGTQTCTTGLTDLSGSANCSILVNQPLGAGTVAANFLGDAFYLPSSASATTILFAFPAQGDFVLGDETATGTVEFWGDDWATVNLLTGGAAPDAFKGFAATTAEPPACGGIWTTRPGNSSDPPDPPLPSFMGVIVSSAVGKSGPTISGNVSKIVVVTTNPGYEANPGHHGTGAVVATFCK
jgi:hypothetical protein